MIKTIQDVYKETATVRQHFRCGRISESEHDNCLSKSYTMFLWSLREANDNERL